MVAIYDLTARQLTNAQSIYRAALPYGRDAVMAALMTAGAESSWLRYANNGKSMRSDVTATAKRVAAVSMSFDHDAIAGEAWTTADSVGLFQQRPMFGYGTVAELMDPYRSTVIFLTGNAAHTTRAFMDAPAGLTLAQRCQWTQGSEFPTGDNYAPFETVAAQLIERFGSVDFPTSPTPTSAGLVDITLEWLSMALTADQQQQLAEYAKQVGDVTIRQTSVTSNVNQQDWSVAAFLASLEETVVAIQGTVVAIQEDVSAIKSIVAKELDGRIVTAWDQPDQFQLIQSKLGKLDNLVITVDPTPDAKPVA